MNITKRVQMGMLLLGACLFAVSVSGAGDQAVTGQSAKDRDAATQRMHMRSNYTAREFQYFVDRSPDGNPARSRAELTPLLLAPRIAIRFNDRSGNSHAFAERLAKKHGGFAEIYPPTHPHYSYADFSLRFSPLLGQHEIVSKLNAIANDSDGTWDVAPLFFVDGREAIVSAVEISLAAPFSSVQISQMLNTYGRLEGLRVEDLGRGTDWRITPLRRMFEIDISTKSAKRFDMHLILLANLLESQQLFSGVKVSRARPVFFYFEEPLAAQFAVKWPSDTIGGLRELELTVLITDTVNVRFDPKKVPAIGTGTFQFASADYALLPGWVKFANDGKITDKNTWTVAGPETLTLGGRNVIRYRLTRQFYLLQPEEPWKVTGLAFPYEEREPKSGRWIGKSFAVPDRTFFVLSHTAKEKKIFMPEPEAYAPPAQALAFTAQPKVTAAQNTHWFAPVVARFDQWGMGASSVFVLVLTIIAFGALLSGGAVALFARERSRVRSRLPQPIPFMTRAEFDKRIAWLRSDMSGLDLHGRFYEAHRLVEELLVSRITMVKPGRVTSATLSQIAQEYERSGDKGALAARLASQVVEWISVVDAPQASLDAEHLTRRFAQLSEKLPELYEALSALPVRMTEAS